MEMFTRCSSLTSSSSYSSDSSTKKGEKPDKITGPWSAEEDRILTRLVDRYGPRNWSLISKYIKGRSGKSCRLRWCNQLSPDVERRPFSAAEDDVIVAAHERYGNRWATIARLLPGRTDNAVKNHWNSTLKRRYQRIDREEIDPMTTLSLAPPGMGGGEDGEAERRPENFWDLMRNVIAREVRDYVTTSLPETSQGFRL